MAEETQATSSTSKKKKEALATEKPVPSAPAKKTSQYVVTVDNESGLAVKIEKLEKTGARKELSKEEYAGILAYASLADPYGAYSQYAQMYSTPAAQAYYQGIVDYLKALTPQG